MKTRNLTIGILFIGLVLVGGWYLYSKSDTLPHELTAAGDRIYKEDGDFYTIQVVYPDKTRLATRTDTSSNADAKAMSAIEEMLKSEIKTFKDAINVSGMSEEEKAEMASSSRQYALGITYLPYNSGSFVSYEFDIYQDTGGAHPNGYYKTLVFDLKGNKVELADLFVSGSNYLETIAAIARTQVEEQIAERAGSEATSTLFAEGFAPTKNNFSNFVDNERILHFFIPPYQVAAYAAGSFEVRIPLLDLGDIVTPGIQ